MSVESNTTMMTDQDVVKSLRELTASVQDLCKTISSKYDNIQSSKFRENLKARDVISTTLHEEISNGKPERVMDWEEVKLTPIREIEMENKQYAEKYEDFWKDIDESTELERETAIQAYTSAFSRFGEIYRLLGWRGADDEDPMFDKTVLTECRDLLIESIFGIETYQMSRIGEFTEKSRMLFELSRLPRLLVILVRIASRQIYYVGACGLGPKKPIKERPFDALTVVRVLAMVARALKGFNITSLSMEKILHHCYARRILIQPSDKDVDTYCKQFELIYDCITALDFTRKFREIREPLCSLFYMRYKSDSIHMLFEYVNTHEQATVGIDHYPELPLEESMNSMFHPDIFTIPYLQKFGQLNIEWTDCLDEHLKIYANRNSIRIFAHPTFFYNCIDLHKEERDYMHPTYFELSLTYALLFRPISSGNIRRLRPYVTAGEYQQIPWNKEVNNTSKLLSINPLQSPIKEILSESFYRCSLPPSTQVALNIANPSGAVKGITKRKDQHKITSTSMRHILDLAPNYPEDLKFMIASVMESNLADTESFVRFPYFAPRLRRLKMYLDSRQPRTIRQLWFDRRNYRSWYHPTISPSSPTPSVTPPKTPASTMIVGSTDPSDAYQVPERANPSYGTGGAVFMPSQAKSPAKSSNSKQGGVAGARHITRNRASYSCHTCRRRKVKCDKAHPVCGNCSKNGTECSYDVAPKKGSASQEDDEYTNHGVKRRRGASRPLDEDVDMSQSLFAGRGGAPELRGGSHAIEARLDKLTNMIERLSKANDSIPVQEMSRQLQNISQVVEPQTAAKPTPSAPNGGAAPKKTANSGAASPHRGGDASGDEFPIPAGNAADPVDPIGSLNLGHLSLEDGRSRYVGTTYWAYISDEINELNQLLRDQTRTHDDSPPDESSNENTMRNAAMKSPRAKISPYSGTHYQARRRSTLRRDNFHQSILFPTGESPTSHEKIVESHMLEDVPSRRQSDILYRGFMSGVHAISPVLHPPTILKSYRAFWDWYDSRNHSGDCCPDPSFIPLLYAIWYGGSVTISLRTINSEFSNMQSRSALSEMLNDQVTMWLANISFPRNPTLHGLAAFLLVQTILSREEQPLASSLFISMALRVAQTMGLHRDPAQFGIQSSEAEARRRIWWHIVHMDSVVAMSSGLPPLVNDENFWDVRETSEIKDTLLGTPQAEQYTKLVNNNLRPRDNPDDPTICGGNSMVNVFYLCARGKYIMARAIRRILRIQLGTKPVTGSDMEELRSILIELQFQLNSLVNRIPLAHHPNAVGQDSHSVASDPSSVSPGQSVAGDGSLPADGPNGCLEQYHTPVLVAFHKWARILLSLFIDKAFCVAYQPFLKNAKSRIWPTARQGALRHCHGFMEKFIALATDADFQPFQWSWPGNHQPMHAAMIMLIDLYERPNTPEAMRSRAFIDKIFSISGPDGGVVGGEDGVTTARPLKDGGKEAWDLMRRLREKAWQKAGLDPQQFWTEQAQIRAGVVSGANTPNQYTTTPTTTSRPGFIPARGKPDAYLMEFANRFYEMTRAQTLPNPVVSSLRQELPRYSPAMPAVTPKPPPSHQQQPTQQYIPSNSPPSLSMPTVSPQQQSLDATLTLANLATETVGTPSNSQHPLYYPQQQPPHMQYPPGSPPPNFPIDGPPATTSPNSVAAAPTPPSMMDPNLNFDWDQWDAVFGQLLPVADELMELDPVAGLELPDIGLGLGNHDNTSDMWPDLKM